MNFSTQDLDHLAKLAHLSLTEQEKQAFLPQIDHILGYMSKLSDVAVDRARLDSLLDAEMQLRDDVVSEADLPLLADNAPDWDAAANAFFVPKI